VCFYFLRCQNKEQRFGGKQPPLDLTDVTDTEEIRSPRPPARRTRVRTQSRVQVPSANDLNITVSEATTDLHRVSESVAYATPSADQIAASMIAQLKGAGLQIVSGNGQQVSNDSLATVFVPPSTSVTSSMPSTLLQSGFQQTSTSVTTSMHSTLPHSRLQQQVSGSSIPPMSTDPVTKLEASHVNSRRGSYFRY